MPDNTDDNVFNLFGEDDDSESDETEGTEVDPSVVAFMDQQSAEFNAKAEHEFADRYGFVHKCRCDQDYTEGNLVEVTECYARMTMEALDACAKLYAENRVLALLIERAIVGGTSAESNVAELTADDTAGDDDHDDPSDPFA